MRITRVATLAWLGAVVFALPVRAEQVCSNGVVEYPESCDDGNSVGGDSCPADCGVAPETSTLAVAGNSAAEGAAGTFNTLAVEVARTGSTNFGINFGMRTLGDSASAGSDFQGFYDGRRYYLPKTEAAAQPGITLIGDFVAELDETFDVEIYGAYRTGDITMETNAPAQAANAAPIGLVAGDFNGDGKPDTVVANPAGDTVSVLTNIGVVGAPDFANPVTEAAGDDPFGLAAADFDNDGNLDLVVANRAAGTLSVLRHVTAPGIADFDDRLPFTLSASPYQVAAGDLDDDGLPDLVATLEGTDQIAVLINATTGTAPGATIDFEDPIYLSTCDAPRGVAIGDMDLDGDGDFVVACWGANQIDLRINNGPIGFGSGQAVTARTNPFGVVLADVDADGKPDVITADTGTNSVSVFKNTSVAGSPLTVEALTAFQVGASPMFVAAQDIDGDTAIDLVAGNRFGDTVSVLRNETPAGGTIAFHYQVTYATGVAPYGVVIADFDGDWQADIATANNTPGTVSVIRNKRPTVGITTATAAATIENDDEALVAFAAETSEAEESDGSKTVTVTLLGVTDETVNVSYTLGGTATQGVDYTISPATLSFGPGDDTRTLTISGLADAAADATATETIVITLVDPANAGLNPPNPHTLTLTNDSVPAVTPPAEPEQGGGGGGSMGLGLLLLALVRRRASRA